MLSELYIARFFSAGSEVKVTLSVTFTYASASMIPIRLSNTLQ
jgi:hypothetical protein